MKLQLTNMVANKLSSVSAPQPEFVAGTTFKEWFGKPQPVKK